jgi:signal transduction histidine kinase
MAVAWEDRDDRRMSTSPLTAHADPTPAPVRPTRHLPGFLVRAVRDFGFLTVGLATGTAFFTVAVTLASLSAGLLVLVVGIPLAAVSLGVLQACAEVERRRIGLVADRPVVGVYRPLPDPLVARAWAACQDPRRWRDLVYLVVQLPLSVAGFCVTVTAWAVALALAFYPLLYAVLPDGGLQIDGWTVDSLLLAFAVVPVGLLLLPVAYVLSRAMVHLEVLLVRALLGDDRARLQARVSRLEETRAGAVDASSAELRRIERDLHDGAQARMVAVAMDLGMAEARIEEDPEGARALVQGARTEARRALEEMRDLVRGIAPSVLEDRGLEAALGSLAGRSRVPVALDVELPERPPVAVETAAYFVVAEALVNVAKHADAGSAAVVAAVRDGVLEVRVQDDGAGGAELREGGGLAGLRDRVAALDGTLSVTSPAGGPTTVETRLPCGS